MHIQSVRAWQDSPVVVRSTSGEDGGWVVFRGMTPARSSWPIYSIYHRSLADADGIECSAAIWTRTAKCNRKMLGVELYSHARAGHGGWRWNKTHTRTQRGLVRRPTTCMKTSFSFYACMYCVVREATSYTTPSYDDMMKTFKTSTP